MLVTAIQIALPMNAANPIGVRPTTARAIVNRSRPRGQRVEQHDAEARREKQHDNAHRDRKEVVVHNACSASTDDVRCFRPLRPPRS
jgi:hypothetical protein